MITLLVLLVTIIQIKDGIMREITVESILKLIKQMRIESGLSQAQAAKAANISTSFYGMIERGNRTLSVDQLIEIVKIFDCNLTDFLEMLEMSGK